MMYDVENAPWYGQQKPSKFTPIPGVPVIPPLPRKGEYAAQCGECGILIPNGGWMYCCPNMYCPVQPKVIC